MEKEHKPDLKEPKSKRSWTFRLFKWCIGIVLFVLLLFCILALVVQNEKFQNWAVSKVTNSLSEQLDTKVSLDYINIEFFDNLSFDNFFIEDYNADTIMHVDNLNIDFDLSIKNIINRDFTINEIYLTDGTVKLRRDSAQFLTNLNMVMNKLAERERKNKKSNTGGKPVNLDLAYLSLENIHFKQNDRLRGQDMNAQITTGRFTFDEFDVNESLINLNSVVLDGIDVNIYEYARNEELFNKLWDYEFMKTIYNQSGTGNVNENENENQSGNQNENGDAPIKNDQEQQQEKIPLVITANSISISNGGLVLNNVRQSVERQMPEDVLDYKKLDVSDISARIVNFNFTICEFTGKVEQLSCKEKSGLVISNVTTEDVYVSERKTLLNGIKLETPYSTVGDTIMLKYRKFADWWEFQDDVRMDVRFKNSKIGLQDIVYFGGILKDNPFFQKNIKESLFIDGRMVGAVNTIGARDISLKLGDKVAMKGSIRTNNITLKDEEFFDVKLGYLTTNVSTLRELIPGFNPPPEFNQLGNLDFGGTFFGFLHDFTADGQLNSDLGSINSDIKLELLEQKQQAKYSGKFAFEDFDLGAWTGNDNIGNITMSAFIEEGTGVKFEDAQAKLNAVIEDFTYQGYQYKNVNFNGELNKNRINGALGIKDDNIVLDFEGDINLEEGTPSYNFESQVEKLNLKQLNLSKKDIFVSGNFDLSLAGNKIQNITGNAHILDLKLTLNDTVNYQIDSVNLVSVVLPDGEKLFDLKSDLFNARLKGEFALDQFAFAIQDYVYEQHPAFAERLNLKKSGKEIAAHQFEFDVKVFDSENLTSFIHPKLDTIKATTITGFLDNVRDTFYLEAHYPRFKFDRIDLLNGHIYIEGNEEKDDVVFTVGEPIIDGKNHFPSAFLTSSINKENLFFNLGLSNFKQKQIEKMLIRGEVKLIDNERYEINLEPSNLTILGEYWNIPGDNKIQFGKDYVNTENFIITNGDQEVKIQSIGEKGLEVLVDNIELEEVNKYINYNLLEFGGDIDVTLSTQDVFTLSDLNLDLKMDTFLISTTYIDTTTYDWGKLTFSASSDNINSEFSTLLQLGFLEEAKGRLLYAKGTYSPPTKGKSEAEKNYFEQNVEITKYPVDLITYFVPTGISGVEGEFSGGFKVFGTPSNPQLEGALNFVDGAVGIDYLGTTYSFNEATVILDNNIFDATGEKISDRNGNTATLRGGIRHDKLKNLNLDLDIITDNDRFLCLDTERTSESLFYGVGIGEGSVEFRGPFNQTDMQIEATTTAGTHVFIPLEDDAEAQDLSFIRFVDKSKEKEEYDERTDFRGVNIDLSLSITDAAEVELIFDEKAGDIVKGRGSGNINIDVKRTGEFSMFGNYIIEQGKYLFTYNYRDILKINKPFEVKRGGVISWSGDPYDAQIDLEADLKGLSQPVYNLISEFIELEGEDVQAEARRPTQVDLTMFIKGDLFEPDISFDINFPELTGGIKGNVDNKMRALRADENELNRQVFGLMMNIGFLPATEGALGGDDAITFGVNTFSQFISNQLSLYISEFLSDIIADGSVISGTEFNVNYNVYDAGDIQNINRASELSLQLENYLFNDRIAVKIGTDFGIGLSEDLVTDDVNVINTFDVVVEWVIAKDRRFKLVVYNKNDQTILGPQTKRGVGFNYRYEFDSLQEFLAGISKKNNQRKKQ